MKIQTLFDLLRASQNLLLAFEGVESPAQLVSRLEKLRRGDAESLLEDVEDLRDAVDTGLSDTIEMSGYQADDNDLPESPTDLDGALDAFPELDGLESDLSQDATGNGPPAAQDVNKEKPAQ